MNSALTKIIEEYKASKESTRYDKLLFDFLYHYETQMRGKIVNIVAYRSEDCIGYVIDGIKIHVRISEPNMMLYDNGDNDLFFIDEYGRGVAYRVKTSEQDSFILIGEKSYHFCIPEFAHMNGLIEDESQRQQVKEHFKKICDVTIP